MNNKNLITRRRGLSSIVGALLFVVLMVSAFAVIGVALNSQTEISSTARDVAAKDLQKQQENFILNNIQQGPNPSDYLEVELTNLGQNPAEMFTLVMTNKSDTGQPTQIFDVPSETSYLPPGDDGPTDIIKTLNLKMDVPALGVTEDYDFKVVSSLGTIKTMSIQCDGDSKICGVVVPPAPPGSPGLSASLFLDGPTGVNSKISTAIMFVQNTGTVPLEDVYPLQKDCLVGTFPTVTENGSPETIPGDFISCTFTPVTDNTCGSAPPPPPNNNDGDGICLEPGQMAIFKWDGTVVGDVGDILTFCNQVKGEDHDGNLVGPTPVSCDSLEIINPNDCGGASCDGGGGQPIILIDDLLIRPSLFMIIPSPWGDPGGATDGKGVWGVNVVNPTEREMSVNKVTIVAYPPGANSNDGIIPSPCGIEAISPNDSFWSCPRQNTIMWQNIGSPKLIPPFSSVSFLAKTQVGSPAGNEDVDALIVQANAQTTAGSFGKASYQSTMFKTNEVIANVYLTNSTNPSRANNAIQSQVLGLTELVPAEFTVTLADMDFTDKSYIKSGSRLIINVPRGWTNVVITNSTNFEDKTSSPPPTGDNRIAYFSDTSHQIIAKTTVDIGGYSGGQANQDTYTPDAVSLTFQATPPLNDILGEGNLPERLYIMYVLADGETGHVFPNGDPQAGQPDPNPIGPLNEIAIQVLQP